MPTLARSRPVGRPSIGPPYAFKLPPELRQAAEEEAERAGVPLAEYVRAALRRAVAERAS